MGYFTEWGRGYQRGLLVNYAKKRVIKRQKMKTKEEWRRRL